MLQRIPVFVQAEEIVVGVRDGMPHKQNLGPFAECITLIAGSEVISGLLQFFG